MGGEVKVQKRWLSGWETSYTGGVIAEGWRFDDELFWHASGRMDTPAFTGAYGYILTPSAELLQYDLMKENGGIVGDYRSGDVLLELWAQGKDHPGLGPAQGLDEDDARLDVADGVARLQREHRVRAD
jgi:hypothetical protein